MKRSKWDVLKVIRDHQGKMTWYPIDTFFPIGTIIEDPNANGMDIVGDFIESGLVHVVKTEAGRDAYSITESGIAELQQREDRLTSK